MARMVVFALTLPYADPFVKALEITRSRNARERSIGGNGKSVFPGRGNGSMMG